MITKKFDHIKEIQPKYIEKWSTVFANTLNTFSRDFNFSTTTF